MTPVRATIFPSGLTSVIVNVVVSLTWIGERRNAFDKTGGPTTIRSAKTVGDGVHSLQVAGPATLCFGLLGVIVLPVTVNVIMQLALPARLAFAKVTELAVMVNCPPQRGETPNGLASSPDGKGSLTATPVIGFPSGLRIVMVAKVEEFFGMLPTAKDFVNGSILATVRVAVAASPIPPFEELGATLLLNTPLLLLVTSTVNMQVPATGKVTPVRVIKLVFAAATGEIPKQSP